MKCNECYDWLSQHIDGELGQEESKMVAEHLSCCQNCRDEYEALSAAKRAVQAIPEHIPPEEFTRAWKAMIAREMSDNPPIVRKRRLQHRARVFMGLGAAAAALLMVVLVSPAKDEFQLDMEQQAKATASIGMPSMAATPVPEVTSPGENEPFAATPAPESVEPRAGESPAIIDLQPENTPAAPSAQPNPEATQVQLPEAAASAPGKQQPTPKVQQGGQGDPDAVIKDNTPAKTVSVSTGTPVNKVKVMLGDDVSAPISGTSITVIVNASNAGKVNSVISQLGGGQTVQEGDTAVFNCGEADYS